MSDAPAEFPYRVRSFQACDQAACRRLYVEGLLGGRLADNDTGTDVDDVASAYMNSEGDNHFWVAEAPDGEVVGMIGVQHHEPGVGEIRRLRVRQDWRRRGVGSALIETALKFCQERQCLKVTLDTYMEREPALKLFEKFRFRHSRTRNVGGKDLLYFYLDLYAGEARAAKGDGA
jgi:ribosomal protein S18 acetylase RimI-like enzyme